jgi:prepilin-type N-terminal cleavage/methylation domain-containing protein
MTQLPSHRHDRDRSRPAERGFTLLEVLVAVAIFALGSVAVLAARSNSFKEAAAAENMNRCRYLLQRQMEAILLEPDRYQDGEEGGFEEEEFARYGWGVDIEEVILIGGDEEGYTDEDDGGRSEERTRRVDIPGGPGDDEAAEGDLEEVTVFRVTVYVYYPTAQGLKHISATTYLPSDRVAEDSLF